MMALIARVKGLIVANVQCISTSWLPRDIDMSLDGDRPLRLNYWRSKLFFLGKTQKLKHAIWSDP